MNKITVLKSRNVDPRIYVDGKKFNCSKDSIPSGEHTIVVKNAIYLAKWYAFLWIVFDFVKAIFGGLIFGEMLERQGSVLYYYKASGKVEGDLNVTIDETVSVEGLLEAKIIENSSKELTRVTKILKRYNFVCGTVFAAIALIIGAAVLIWGIFAGWWLF